MRLELIATDINTARKLIAEITAAIVEHTFGDITGQPFINSRTYHDSLARFSSNRIIEVIIFLIYVFSRYSHRLIARPNPHRLLHFYFCLITVKYVNTTIRFRFREIPLPSWQKYRISATICWCLYPLKPLNSLSRAV